MVPYPYSLSLSLFQNLKATQGELDGDEVKLVKLCQQILDNELNQPAVGDAE
jgi:hypothetical protein